MGGGLCVSVCVKRGQKKLMVGNRLNTKYSIVST